MICVAVRVLARLYRSFRTRQKVSETVPPPEPVGCFVGNYFSSNLCFNYNVVVFVI
ncbi:MAG: hypothetical protein UX66_C0018G0008 [Parcubacteria group bacterium GW2011_GWF2_46_8]|nr:MAG: hypothetical protein UX66_C0018G0008 [Parcubacteria group bacterium GW2011_GWF2_46_8]